MEYESRNESETFQFGRQLGNAIATPFTIFLSGTLGAGKTRLVQALANGLGIPNESVNSPTFTIMVPHHGRMTLLHVDAYRIKDLDEAEQLGIDDWVEDGCVLVVEWAERIDAVLPQPDLRIEISHTGETSRKFAITAESEKGTSILEAFEATG